MKTKITLLTMLFIGTLTNAQSIEKFSIDSGGASTTAGGIEILYTIGEVNVQELSTATISVSEGFINTNFKVNIDPKIFLQGPMLNQSTAGLMNDDLRVGNYLPSTSPYADNATVVPNVFNTGGISGTGLAQDDIVDWVWIEVRQGNDNTKIIRAQSALLQRDGDIVGVDGVSTLKMNAAPTNYYVVVKHRNHLGVMTLTSVGLTEVGTTIVDFKSNAQSTYGSNARVQLTSGNMALWAGDTDNSDAIKFSGANNDTNIIKDAVLANPSNGFGSVTFSSTGYLSIDVDMNGIGKFSGAGNDSNLIKDNVLSHPSNGFSSSTFTINTTVPPGN